MKSLRHSQGGFTLVEMMVALALGLMLSVVIAQLFSNTRVANLATEDAGRVQESMRYANDALGRTIRIAGYKSDPTAVSSTVFPAAAPALDDSNGAGTASDMLIVRFQGAGTAPSTADSTILDCLGTPVAPDFVGINKSYNKFSIAPGADGRNALFCSTDPLVNPGTELVPGVEAMQVLLGEDTTADGAADRFLPPGTAGLNVDNVVAVRVYLLFAGRENVRIDASAQTFTLAGVAYNYADRKIRRVMTNTVALRNRAP